LSAAFLLWDAPVTGLALLGRLEHPYAGATVANLKREIDAGAAHQFPGLAMYYHAGPDGVQTSLDAGSAGDLATLLAEDPGHTLWIELYFRGTDHGLWAVTSTRAAYVVRTSYGHELAPAQVAEARAMFARWLAERGHIPSMYAPGLASADTQIVHRRWAGYIHNAASLLALAAFTLTLRWIPAARAAARRATLTRRGRCPFCGYSVSGLRTPRCPECGRTLAGV
jgi:hypothetical protein